LLITLALIIAISALIATGLTYIDKLSTDTKKKHMALQNFVFIQNAADILAKKKKMFSSASGLEMLFLLPIELKAKDLSLQLSFTSTATGLNPNNLIKKERKKLKLNPDYILLFDRILQTYDVQNKELFLALLEDTLDPDLEERIPGSEMALYNRRFAQGKIENYQKFRMLLDRYVLLTEDINIYTIPWKKLLSFYSTKIDFNYIEPDLLRYMLPYIDQQTIQRLTTAKESVFTKWKELGLPKEDIDELKKFNIAFYVPVIRGELRFREGGEATKASFVYDIDKKKVVDIEYQTR